ncbi:MAG: DUF421 domain-containing protein [Firmicutes bacterium]|nr:DUF421 domain-containing protein [Bacillota bacterium]
MLITLARTVVLYTLVVVTMRVMGKRQIGQLEPFELVIAIMIAELAAVPMQDRHIPLINGFISIITLLFVQVTLSLLSLKFMGFRTVLDGKHSVVIANGIIQEKEMQKARYNLHELLEQLRVQGFYNISDVEFAILETSGDLSVIPKSQKRPVTPKDLNIDTVYEGLPTVLIMDGQVLNDGLNQACLTEAWLRTELAKFGIKSPKDVFFAVIDTEGKLFFQPRAAVTEEVVQ